MAVFGIIIMDLYSITYLQPDLYRPPLVGNATPHGHGPKFYGSDQN